MRGQNAPRTLTPADFAGGRYWLIAPGPMTPKQLVIGTLAEDTAPVASGERVLLDLPQFKEVGLAAFDGSQVFEIREGGLPQCCEPEAQPVDVLVPVSPAGNGARVRACALASTALIEPNWIAPQPTTNQADGGIQ